uniref:Uncharacterized protein n=1 Tax=Pipistrellus kuhlii TaxID=59472 RepID=A0A7J8A950_PIPKU|nr:hypothetical protein mPipKuh1_009039 [Pipistrellus kuhlii]
MSPAEGPGQEKKLWEGRNSLDGAETPCIYCVSSTDPGAGAAADQGFCRHSKTWQGPRVPPLPRCLSGWMKTKRTVPVPDMSLGLLCWQGRNAVLAATAAGGQLRLRLACSRPAGRGTKGSSQACPLQPRGPARAETLPGGWVTDQRMA